MIDRDPNIFRTLLDGLDPRGAVDKGKCVRRVVAPERRGLQSDPMNHGRLLGDECLQQLPEPSKGNCVGGNLPIQQTELSGGFRYVFCGNLPIQVLCAVKRHINRLIIGLLLEMTNLRKTTRVANRHTPQVAVLLSWSRADELRAARRPCLYTHLAAERIKLRRFVTRS